MRCQSLAHQRPEASTSWGISKKPRIDEGRFSWEKLTLFVRHLESVKTDRIGSQTSTGIGATPSLKSGVCEISQTLPGTSETSSRKSILSLARAHFREQFEIAGTSIESRFENMHKSQ
jgi:hypothetical protein